MRWKESLDNLARDMHLPRFPFWMLALVLIFTVLTWVPLAIIARARVTPSNRPRLALIQDMDNQTKGLAQARSVLFEDARVMRPPVPGTIARGELHEDKAYELGYSAVTTDKEGKPAVEYVGVIPDEVTVDRALVERGRVEFNVYCSPCHGYDARGTGRVNQRAMDLAKNPAGGLGTGWVSASNLMQWDENAKALQYGPEAYPDGKLYSVIRNGIRNMPAYGSQIDIHDRWAIVAYVRALQLAQHAPANAIPAEKRDLLK